MDEIAESRKRKNLSRDSCFCGEAPKLPLGHLHCYCNLCEGMPVSRSTFYRHRNNTMALDDQTDEQEQSKLSHIPSPINNPSDPDDSDSDEAFSEYSDDSHLPSPPPDETESIKRDVLNAVLEAFDLADYAKGSQKFLMKTINYGRKLYCKGNENLEKYWPTSWHQCIKLLESIGYEEPKPYFPCLSDKHKTKWSVLNSVNEQCELCSETPDASLGFYYLNLTSKIRKWFSSPEMCEKMLAHWRAKDHWYYEDTSTPHFPMCEIWDGKHFREISYFFDPEKQFLLPSRCSSCSAVLSPEVLTSGEKISDNESLVTCFLCSTSQVANWQYAFGNPRNIVLIGHFDGWQYSNPGVHGGGSIEISIANMKKSERNHVSEVYVNTFIPVGALPRNKPYKYDPFLQPLVEELTQLYIKGLDINYPLDVDGSIKSGKSNIRCMLYLWTGDLPAQCEIGKFIFAGKKACRREHMTGQLDASNNRYYYVNNRFLLKHPPRVRDISEDLEIIMDIENETRSSVRAEKSKESGYTGLSILYSLNLLYGFDISRDLVFDVMHNLPLNVVRKQLDRLVNDCDLSEELVDDNLASVKWTSELKDGRVPRKFSSRRSFWKAEEFQKFAFPILEISLGGLVSDKDFHLVQLMSRMVEMTFQRRSSWFVEDFALFEKLVKRFLVLLEEWGGARQCVITSHNLVHILDDIFRFGLVDNFWCWPYERCVAKYIRVASNHKSREGTFARAECRREAIKFSLKDEEHGQYLFDFVKIAANSLESARYHAKTFGHGHDNGILIGGLKNNEKLLSAVESDMIFDRFGSRADGQVSSFKSLFMPTHQFDGMVYRIGEFVICFRENADTICEILNFVSIIIQNERKVLVKVNIYQYLASSFSDEYSGFKRIKKDATMSGFLEVRFIKRKIMLKEEDANLLIIDMYRDELPISYDDISIPCFIEVDDFVQVCCEEGSYFGRVRSTKISEKTAKVVFYEKSPPLWRMEYPKKEETVAWDTIYAILEGEYDECQNFFERD